MIPIFFNVLPSFTEFSLRGSEYFQIASSFDTEFIFLVTKLTHIELSFVGCKKFTGDLVFT